MQTRHGQFRFCNQKFWCAEQGSHAFLQATETSACAVTRGLQSLAVHTCLQASSYEKAREMLVEVTGASLLTRQTLCNWVARTAQRADRHLACTLAQAQDCPLPPLASVVDVYDGDAPEVIVFEDGILVKAQKPCHEPSAQKPCHEPSAQKPCHEPSAQKPCHEPSAQKPCHEPSAQKPCHEPSAQKPCHEPSAQKPCAPASAKPCQFHQAYFALSPCPGGHYEFVMASTDAQVTLPAALRAHVCTRWHDTLVPLALIAITDGARGLRNDLEQAFGSQVVTILDWFHLRKKVCELCSMLVATKQARTDLKQQMLKLLFHGRVSEALEVLAQMPVRNALMHQKLQTYLNRHAHEIIDYARRAQAKKTIGSGRMEKGVDQVVGIRQKDNGMSWSKAGSYALGMLTAYRANGCWEQLWNTSAGAA